MNTKFPMLHLVAVYSCVGAQDERCSLGPIAIRHAGIEDALQQRYRTAWQRVDSTNPSPDTVSAIADVCEQLATTTAEICAKEEKFLVLGGDHSCAIGTWSGVKRYYSRQQFGLIWIDAHMDSHLPETSPSRAIHGMPLACLLGHGQKRFRSLAGHTPALFPQNTCLIGVRSYEPEERALLELLGVKVFYIDEVNRRGFDTILQESLNYIQQHTEVYGISIDLDAFDPGSAPGVGSPERNGLTPEPVIQALRKLRNDPNLIGMELVELNPVIDEELKTAKLCVDLATAIF